MSQSKKRSANEFLRLVVDNTAPRPTLRELFNEPAPAPLMTIQSDEPLSEQTLDKIFSQWERELYESYGDD